tara:strand:- start:405 stop:677 length:273 start_codon:yes stop_codon:yes gene_type:complete
METKKTINVLSSVIKELKENDEFKIYHQLDLIKLATKIIDLSLKDKIRYHLEDLKETSNFNNASLNEQINSLDDICNALYNINTTLNVHL